LPQASFQPPEIEAHTTEHCAVVTVVTVPVDEEVLVVVMLVVVVLVVVVVVKGHCSHPLQNQFSQAFRQPPEIVEQTLDIQLWVVVRITVVDVDVLVVLVVVVVV
jgi:hypothetical protein